MHTKNNKLISVIVPTYNYSGTLERAVNSVTNQNGDDFEVVIIDDGSTDHTKAVALNLVRGSDGSVRYIYKTNGGTASARNLGLMESMGKYIVFLDADDALDPDAIGVLRSILRWSRVDLILGSYLVISEDGTTRKRFSRKIHNDGKDNFRAYLRNKIHICNGSYCVSRNLADRIRFNENIRQSEDIPFFALMIASAGSVGTENVLAHIYRHDDSKRYREVSPEENPMEIVREIFDSPMLPPELRCMKGEFIAHLYLSLFRRHYSAGNYKNAVGCYHSAVRNYFMSLLKLKHTGKYLSALANRNRKS